MKCLFSRGFGAVLLACVLFNRAEAQTSLELFAGGDPFVDAPANTVPVRPRALALGPDGVLYVSDEASNKILRFDPATSTITSVPNLPGMLEYRFNIRAMGYGPGAVLNILTGANEKWQLDLVDGTRYYEGPTNTSNASTTFTADGSMYFTRNYEHAVFRRSPTGTVTTVAGSTQAGFSGDGTTSALFNNPRGVAVDAAGNVYIADRDNHRIRRRAAGTGIVTTIAGTGLPDYNGDNLLATQTNLSTPTHLAIDSAGNLYINEEDTYRIRKLNVATGRITDFAGNGVPWDDPGNGGPATNASINGVLDMEITSSGTLYIAENYSYRVRKVDASGIISHVIGNGLVSFCGEGVPARQACLALPNGVAVDNAGDVYISDKNNKRIRKVSAATGLITTIAGGMGFSPNQDGILASDARFPNGTSGLQVDASRNLYFVEGNRVRRIDAATGILSTVAGTGAYGFAGDGGPAVSAVFGDFSRFALDRTGNIYISDTWNRRIRRVDASTGIITTIAGNGQSTGPLGDGGPATEAVVSGPDMLAFDPAGNLLIVDTYNYRIRKVNIATGVITTIAGNGSYYNSGNGGPATSAGIGFRPVISVDAGGNIYVLSGFPELRRIDAQTGIINPAPAPMWGLYTPEGRGFESPTEMTLGPDNRLYIADGSNVVLRVSGLPTPASDLTPPVIEPHITGTLGNDGWYRSNVQVTWSVTDPESEITTIWDCEDSAVTWDTEGRGLHCVATSAGGTSQRYIEIKRDATPPQVTFGTPSPAPGASGWNSTDVSVPFTVTDALSGVSSNGSTSPVTVSGTGPGLSETVIARDVAGNVVSVSTPAVNIDRSPPQVIPNVSGTLGNNGWYRGDVDVSWSVGDGESGITSSTGCAETAVTADTTGLDFTCTVTSPGGTTTRTVTVKKDTTPPSVTFGAQTPAPNAAGWNNTNVSFPYTLTDALSGVSHSTVPSPVTVTAEGYGTFTTFLVEDLAGNSNAIVSPLANIDRTPPTIEILTPEQGRAYGAFTTTNAQYTCSDNLSPQAGINCAGPVPNGAPFSTNPSGARTFVVTATDRAGNQATTSRAYSVRAMVWAGWVALRKSFLLNQVPAGSLVPIRWRQTDGFGVPVSNLAAFQGLSVTSYNCANSGGAVIPLNDTATGGPGLTYSASTQAFTYNWQTDSSWAGQCRRVLLQFANGSSTEVLFQF